MARRLGSPAFGIVLSLTILLVQKTSWTDGGKLDAATGKQLNKQFFKSLSSGTCNGEKVDVKKAAKSVADVVKKCKPKDKDEIPVTCYMAEIGYIKSPTEAYEDQKKVVKNLQKGGWYSDSMVKKIVKEVYSQNCHKQFVDQSTAEEGSMCLMNAVLKVCEG